MAIGFRAFTGPTGSAGAGSLTLVKPTGTVSTDVMIACIKDDTDGGFTAPGTWQLITSKNDLGFGTTYFFWALGSETNFGWTIAASGANGAIGVVCSYSGCDNTTPIGAVANSSTAGGASPFTWSDPSVTSTIDNSFRVVGYGYCDQSGGAGPSLVANGVLNRVSGNLLDSTGGIRNALVVGDVNITPAGASGATTATATGGNPAGGTQQALAFVLQPSQPTPSDEGGGFYFLPARSRTSIRIG